MNGSITTGRPWGSNGTSGIPLNVTLHSWPVPPPEPENKPPPVEIDTSRHNISTRIFNLNATGYIGLDDDITEAGLTDVQTLILAGLGTLLTLIVAVGSVLGLRLLWVKYRHSKSEDYAGVLQREESSEPDRGQGPHELKSSESQFTAGTSDEPAVSPTVLTPKSNGSVITMTLKNNHLIVETEETMDTSPSVRVDSRGSTTTYVTNVGFPSEAHANASQPSSTDHGALIHRVPDEVEDEDRGSCQTGLSQSDLSMSSSGSQNQSYRYGNQVGYDLGGFGYPETPSDPLPPRPSNSSSRELGRYSRSSSLFDRVDSVGSASDLNACLIGKSRDTTEERLESLEESITSADAAKRSQSIPNGNDRPSSLAMAASKISRCEELRRESSPLNEVEKFPDSSQKATS